VALSGNLVKLGVNVKERLKEAYPKILEMASSGKEKKVMRDFLREVFYSMGREAVEKIIDGYKKAKDKKEYLYGVVQVLSQGVEDLISACNERLEKMVRSMEYEETVGEGIIRRCFANLMKSEMLGEVEYMPGEIRAVSEILMESGIMNDPSFKRKFEDLKSLSSLKAEYEHLKKLLLPASKPGYKPTKEEMKKLSSALEGFLEKAQGVASL